LIDESRKKLRCENLFFPDARIFLPQTNPRQSKSSIRFHSCALLVPLIFVATSEKVREDEEGGLVFLVLMVLLLQDAAGLSPVDRCLS
jgi:hypothetical protein